MENMIEMARGIHIMEYIIRKCTADDADGRGTVHYQAWKETYTGLMPDEYLNKLSLDNLIETDITGNFSLLIINYPLYFQNNNQSSIKTVFHMIRFRNKGFENKL